MSMAVTQMDQRPQIKERHKTPREVQEFAFQLWAYECGRDSNLVAKELGCARRTVQRWIDRNGWETRARHELASIMPDLQHQTSINLRLGAFNASKRLNQIAVASLAGQPPDAKEVDSLAKIVDRGGFSPVGQNQPALPNAPAKLHDGTEPATIDDLLARHRDRLNGTS